MANTKRMTTTVKNTTIDNDKNIAEETISKPKKFSDDDYIECVSITPGEYFYEGVRTKELYTWADCDDTRSVAYNDLMYAVRTKSAFVYAPRVIIHNDEFLAQHPDIQEVYGSLYSASDLRAMMNYSPDKMKKAIESLPNGAKDAFKVIVMSEIQKGKFDSIAKIKVIDEVFDTNMLFKLTNA